MGEFDLPGVLPRTPILRFKARVVGSWLPERQNRSTRPKTGHADDWVYCDWVELRSLPPFAGVPRDLGLKVPHGVLSEQFWAPASKCPKECFSSGFWRFLAPKSAKNHSKSTLWGTPRQVPKIAQKALRGALSGPGPEALQDL